MAKTRQEANMEILDILREHAVLYPDWRFHQILQNSGCSTANSDQWYEESEDTLNSMKSMTGKDEKHVCICRRYATVKMSNENPYHRAKRGRIVAESNGKVCLEIETVNSCSKDGSRTLMGAVYPNGYENIWFDRDELEDFAEYDGNEGEMK